MENEPDQFHRLSLLLGQDALKTLQNSFVTVVGLGAVGGYVTEALARSGVGKLRLIDHDVVKPSNINRQLLALWDTVDRKKCEVAKKRVLSINPNCKVEALDIFVHTNSVNQVIVQDEQGDVPNFVVDAIDSLNPKIELLTALSVSKIPFISSMGAALRTDPRQIKIGPLSKATYCPLAAILRKYLRRRSVSIDFECVYSEEPVRTLRKDAILPLEESEDSFLSQGRKRVTLGSLPTLTGIFGLIIANEVILKIAQSVKKS